jgi:hypothetical protein
MNTTYLFPWGHVLWSVVLLFFIPKAAVVGDPIVVLRGQLALSAVQI